MLLELGVVAFSEVLEDADCETYEKALKLYTFYWGDCTQNVLTLHKSV